MNVNEMLSFVMRNLTLLSNARLAIAGYGASGSAAIIELNNPDGLEKLKVDLRQLLKVDSSSQKTESATAVATRGRVVLAGARAVVERFIESDATLTLDEDREYLKARAHFAGDPFFTYMDGGALPFALLSNSNKAQSRDFMADVLGGLGQMPYGIAMGGSMDSQNATLRALILSGKKQRGGLMESIISSVQEGQPTAAAFAAPDTDVFVNIMIDWDKLYEGLQSIFDMLASAVASMGKDEQEAMKMPSGVNASELLAGLDAMLGFSIRYDLLPTLGNELAITTSGFDSPLTAKASTQAVSNQRKTSGPSKFLLMIALRNPVKFESYLMKLLSGPNKSPVNLAQMPYRGSIIKYRNGFAYAIAGGFFIAGGDATAIRRALDVRATGASLAANAGFRSAVGPARPVMLQAYFSPKMSGGFSKTIAARGEMKSAERMRSPLGLVMTTNPDGMMMQMRMPSRIALEALASMTSPDSSVPGINYSSGTSPGVGKGRRSPTLTTEDLRYRRP
jgi:hypothetical protein